MEGSDEDYQPLPEEESEDASDEGGEAAGDDVQAAAFELGDLDEEDYLRGAMTGGCLCQIVFDCLFWGGEQASKQHASLLCSPGLPGACMHPLAAAGQRAASALLPLPRAPHHHQ